MKLDYDQLENAFDDSTRGFGEYNFWLDTETGAVLLLTKEHFQKVEALAGPPAADADPLLQAAYEAELGSSDRYRLVPFVESGTSYQDMVDFTETIGDSHLAELLAVALDGKGAFRRFKDVLTRHSEERTRWFAYRSARLRVRIDEWLKDEGLFPVEGTEAAKS